MGKYYHKSIEDIEITDICYDSREVKKDTVFVCIEGENDDGHRYAGQAVRSGARVIIAEKPISCGGNIIFVENTRKVLKELINKFYGVPKVKLIGITGTNGKTTVSHMIAGILGGAGIKTGIIGTNGVYIDGKECYCSRNTPTTPNQLELYKALAEMEKQDVKYCAMEVSSHALIQDRVYGLWFDTAVFTNLTQDHLDFHTGMDDYFSAKKRLFQISDKAVINTDDIYGRKLLDEMDATSFGITNGDVRADNIKLDSGGSEFDLIIAGRVIRQRINIPGLFSVYNALAAATACAGLGISAEDISKGLESIGGIVGRMEHAYFGDVNVIIDYAHTPDGLSKVLESLKTVTDGRLICVFGCGGDRDRTKRAVMGNIATNLSSLAVITSDNPRTEPPNEIIIDILSGVKRDNYIVIENREKAIRMALSIAKKGDTVLLAGKGQESYQIIGNEKHYFNERDIVKSAYLARNGEKDAGIYDL